MDIDDVLDLLAEGVGEPVIMDQIEAEDVFFDLTTDDILDLKRAGASDDLIRAMIRADGSQRGSERRPASTTNVTLLYDPFGYYWWATPVSYSYYYPFDWWDCGFYYAGWWNHRWWRGGLWANHYWDHWHWSGPHWPRHGHSHWSDWNGPSKHGPGRDAWGRTRRGPSGNSVAPPSARDRSPRSAVDRPAPRRPGGRDRIAPPPERSDRGRRSPGVTGGSPSGTARGGEAKSPSRGWGREGRGSGAPQPPPGPPAQRNGDGSGPSSHRSGSRGASGRS